MLIDACVDYEQLGASLHVQCFVSLVFLAHEA